MATTKEQIIQTFLQEKGLSPEIENILEEYEVFRASFISKIAKETGKLTGRPKKHKTAEARYEAIKKSNRESARRKAQATK